ncbi:ATP-binding protein [Streptomyces sp. NPDC058220]|uniref:ATP-binding protein n=1 Tax=Streptomyces sp. NPDC058220 TaxID=3346387 RepID=UPI0036E325C1
MNHTKRISRPAPTPIVVRGDSAAGVHRVRDIVRTFTGGLAPAPDSDTAESLVLVVSELVTNALRHGGGRYTLVLSAGADLVHVAVSDPSPTPPRERAPDLNGGSGGFGWHMVRRLSHRLAITPGPGPGKTVHAQLRR